ncbi:histidine triad nucleotide-binding protein [Desulfuribacillus alkaliarsenatis]|uniref:Histidine triad nucleotide-binding protein n=1 Tax=Desulfuribacillus alkaliarsenatis TaxID=766136 RepID=A0A1E5G074_9FIRM|nr:histidine triad nucleotide-binding protein [Desulfuribacillus alkaliarsenatis]OEF96231.1 histidine triad nucleotide-binding protein [Desulfuribacillus alkaliarsenatis]
MSKDCIFCKIVEGEIPSKKVYEDDMVLAFHDITPVAPVHVLIIPKKHISSILDIDESDAENYIAKIHLAAKKIAKDLGIAENGFRLVNNCGDAGGQTVYHIHYHLLGGRNLSWPPG